MCAAQTRVSVYNHCNIWQMKKECPPLPELEPPKKASHLAIT